MLEDERKEMRQAILDRLNPGDVVPGVISNIVDFGAFVDLDGMDGLIHISELSWSHVNHPSEVLEIGQEVQVKVLDIDRDRQRISLGLKQTQSDPWQQVLDSYSVNDVVQGRVTKVVTFGAFVEILPGVEGLVHISELAAHHVENPREVVSQGDIVSVKVIEMDAERRRLSLSLKRVEGEEPRPRPEGAPPLRLSEEVFTEPRPGSTMDIDEAPPLADAPVDDEGEPVEAAEEPAESEPAAEAVEVAEPEPAEVAETEPVEAEAAPDEVESEPEAPVAEAAAAEPEAAPEEVEPEPEPEAPVAEAAAAEPEAPTPETAPEPEAEPDGEAEAGDETA